MRGEGAGWDFAEVFTDPSPGRRTENRGRAQLATQDVIVLGGEGVSREAEQAALGALDEFVALGRAPLN